MRDPRKDPRKYQVEIQICVGKKQPFPIPGFPELPCYIFGTVGPEESEEEAKKRAERLAELNPGYQFVRKEVSHVE